MADEQQGWFAKSGVILQSREPLLVQELWQIYFTSDAESEVGLWFRAARPSRVD